MTPWTILNTIFFGLEWHVLVPVVIWKNNMLHKRRKKRNWGHRFAQHITLPETNSSHLKMDGWKMLED